MKKTILLLVTISMFVTLLCGCKGTTRVLGGTTTIELPKGKKLINITWKDSNIWYLTKPMKEEDKEETYEFQEDSNFGVVNGTVIIKEHK